MAHTLKPESLMMSFGYEPARSEGAIKCPIFQTSTFVFSSAEEGKKFFQLAYGLREKAQGEEPGLIYSRLNNPDLQILEERLCLWDGAEECAVFESGMSALTTVLLEFLRPQDTLLYSMPLYGGSEHFILDILPRMGISAVGFRPGESAESILQKVRNRGRAGQVPLILVETPANPTNELVDLQTIRRVADALSCPEGAVRVAVDNTYLGPLWQHPLKHGADLVLYSATKYIGGHSDVIAGAVLGSQALVSRVKNLRTFLGNMAGPWTGWLLLRSLETLKVRMEQQAANAVTVAQFLCRHPKVKKVNYLGLLEPSHPSYAVFLRQCTSPGAMLSFEVAGGEKEAFAFLNALKLIKLAVSLGSTESLAEHPASMTHAGLLEEHRRDMGIGDNLVRLSVGIENAEDIVWDIGQALEEVKI